jgi:hypothetical protein
MLGAPRPEPILLQACISSAFNLACRMSIRDCTFWPISVALGIRPDPTRQTHAVPVFCQLGGHLKFHGQIRVNEHSAGDHSPGVVHQSCWSQLSCAQGCAMQ